MVMLSYDYDYDYDLGYDYSGNKTQAGHKQIWPSDNQRKQTNEL